MHVDLQGAIERVVEPISDCSGAGHVHATRISNIRSYRNLD
jgi:hypothetical protein